MPWLRVLAVVVSVPGSVSFGLAWGQSCRFALGYVGRFGYSKRFSSAVSDSLCNSSVRLVAPFCYLNNNVSCYSLSPRNVIWTCMGVCGFACRQCRDYCRYIFLAVGMWSLGRLAQRNVLVGQGNGHSISSCLGHPKAHRSILI